MVPRVGQRIGPYEILGRLGSGGMGLVFSAWDARLQRDVAIKILREEYATPTMRSRFLQEARAASGLNHPNICTVFDIGEVSGDPFLVMELLKGETLRARISRSGKLAPEDIHRIANEVLDALAVAHGRGVIHRDIKPANIILVNKPGGGFQAKVLDFGLAKVEMGDDDSTRHDLTTIGTTVGTVCYMSPEQARGEPVDARSDLFSLGSVLYEAVTGELPFQGATSALIFVELLGKNPAPVRQHNAVVPKDLDRFITRLLAKAPADRFQSAKAALEALQGVSLRKSPFDAITLWGGKGSVGKSRTEATPTSPAEGPGQSPNQDAGAGLRNSEPPAGLRPTGEAGTVLRPARRVADPFAQRQPNPASPLDLDRSPPPPQLAEPPLPVPPPKGAVVLRPQKPDPARTAPQQYGRPGDAAEPVSDISFVAAPEPSAPIQGLSAERSAVPSADFRDPLGPTTEPVDATEDASSPPLLGSPDFAAYTDGIPASSLARRHAEDENPKQPRRRWEWLVVALLIPPTAAAFAWYFISHPQSIGPSQPVSIVLAGMQNGTGDSSLSGVLTAGLAFAAAQSPHLSVRSTEDYAVALRATGHAPGSDVSVDQARAAARGAGAGVLVFGNIRSAGGSYELSLRLFEVASGKRLAEVAETAANRDQITEALDQLAFDMRSALGESRKSVSGTAIPLSKDATSNLDALLAFASGASLQAQENSADALLAFQRAAGLDPHFTQAYLRLVGLYREQYAEAAAARFAAEARKISTSAGARTQALAQAAYAMDVMADYGRAVDLLTASLSTYPGDLQTMDALARAEMLAGKFSDAQATAERALQLSPFDAEASAEEERALIAQGRPEAVVSVEAQAKAAGINHPSITALAEAASAVGTDMLLPPADRELPPYTAGSLLDAAGHFNEGATRWQAMAQAARSAPERISAAAYANGMAALNRALADDCGAALPLAQTAQSLPSGMFATFSAGEAEALCGDLDGAHRSLVILNAISAPGSAAQAYLAPDLSATLAWKAGDTVEALRLLDGARTFDPVSLTAYLRGLVEISAHQPQLSIVQFQAVLGHRGAATLFNPEIYPLAQLGLGRAYAASGDLGNSSVAYGRFLELWSSADPGLKLVAEARIHAHL